MRMKYATLYFSLPILLLAAFAPRVAAAAKTPESKPRAGAADPFVSGPPLSFDQVLRLLRQTAIPPRRQKQAIQNRGVDFTVSSAEIAKLKAAGATEEMLELIKSKGRQTSASQTLSPAVPRKTEGAISVSCAPAECDIALNGTALGSTHQGTLQIAKVRPGSWTVDFKKNGYIGSQAVLTVEADKTASASVILEPSRAMQETLGAELFDKMLDAFGGPDGIKLLQAVQAVGGTTIWTRDGQSARWTLLMRNRPDRALFQILAGAGTLHEVAFLGNQYKTSKNLRGQDAVDLSTDCGFIRDNQISSLLDHLSNPQFKMVALHNMPAVGEEYSLVAEGLTEKVSIGFDRELRPQRVRIASDTGIGSGVVTYSDYVKKEGTAYPVTMQIKPDNWQHGIEVRFDNVDFTPKFRESDYSLKGKPQAGLGK